MKKRYLVSNVFSIGLMQVVTLDGAMFRLVGMGGEVSGCTLLPNVVKCMFGRVHLGEIPIFQPQSHTNVHLQGKALVSYYNNCK